MSIKIPDDAGEIIKNIRGKLGISQNDFGKLIGIRQAAVSQIENGITKPSPAVWLSIKNQYVDNQPSPGSSRHLIADEEQRYMFPDPGAPMDAGLKTRLLLSKALQILESETKFSIALAQNIDAFFDAIRMLEAEQRKDNRPNEVLAEADRRKLGT